MPALAASERDRLRADFVRRAGWGDAGERLLAGDASFRKYFRLSRPRGSAVVMDAPPPQEDVRPFVRIGRHLIGLGLSAPAIHAEDEANGFLLLEGLGDDTFARVLAAGGDEGELYGHATDVLVVLHHAGKRALLPGLGAYAGEALIDAAMLLPDWYLAAATGRPTPDEETLAYRAAWRTCGLLSRCNACGAIVVVGRSAMPLRASGASKITIIVPVLARAAKYSPDTLGSAMTTAAACKSLMVARVWFRSSGQPSGWSLGRHSLPGF